MTIENFGGSQDQLNLIGRAFEREKTFTNIVHEPAVPVRSSMADARGSILFDYDDSVSTMTTSSAMNTSEKQDHETEKQPPIPMRRKSQTTDLHSKDILDGDITMQHQPPPPQPHTANNNKILCDDGTQSIRKTSFAALPNTTTWQQQSVNYQKANHQSECSKIVAFYIHTEHQIKFLVNFLVDSDETINADVHKLSTVRMAIEEKRRQLVQDKRQKEASQSRHQQEFSKAAFLQAINKVRFSLSVPLSLSLSPLDLHFLW